MKVDETYMVDKKSPKAKCARGYSHKHAVLTPVERGGSSRSFHVDGKRANDILPILRANIAKETLTMPDKAGQYAKLGNEFAGHETVAHSVGEYVQSLGLAA